MSEATYSLQRVSGIPADIFMRLIRTRFQSDDDMEGVDRFLRDFEGDPIVDKIKEQWSSLEPYRPEDSTLPFFAPIAHKRLLFWAIRPELFFQTCQRQLVASYEDIVSEPIWGRDGVSSTRTRPRRYEVYVVDTDELGIPSDQLAVSDKVGVLRCWCPSTGREHWIMVPSLVLFGYGQNTPLGETPRDIVNNVLAYVFFGINNRWSSRETLKVISGHYLYRQGDLIFRRADRSAPVYPDVDQPYWGSRQGKNSTPDILSHLKAEA